MELIETVNNQDIYADEYKGHPMIVFCKSGEKPSRFNSQSISIGKVEAVIRNLDVVKAWLETTEKPSAEKLKEIRQADIKARKEKELTELENSLRAKIEKEFAIRMAQERLDKQAK